MATLHNSAKSLGMLLSLGAARCCKQKLNPHLSEKPKQYRWFMLCLICGCFQHSFLKWTGNRKKQKTKKPEKMTAFAWQLQSRWKLALIFLLCPSSPSPVFFFWELNYGCMRRVFSSCYQLCLFLSLVKSKLSLHSYPGVRDSLGGGQYYNLFGTEAPSSTWENTQSVDSQIRPWEWWE